MAEGNGLTVPTFVSVDQSRTINPLKVSGISEEAGLTDSAVLYDIRQQQLQATLYDPARSFWPLDFHWGETWAIQKREFRQ